MFGAFFGLAVLFMLGAWTQTKGWWNLTKVGWICFALAAIFLILAIVTKPDGAQKPKQPTHHVNPNQAVNSNLPESWQGVIRI
jgi:uncharacterized membrane protein